jgi:hypothetical protein
MNNKNVNNIEHLYRQIIADNIKRLGIDAVIAMAKDLRNSGYIQKADLVDLLINEYNTQALNPA